MQILMQKFFVTNTKVKESHSENGRKRGNVFLAGNSVRKLNHHVNKGISYSTPTDGGRI